MPWLSESYYLAQEDEFYQEALRRGSASADEHSRFGAGGGNVTGSFGKVVSIAGKFGSYPKSRSKNAAHSWRLSKRGRPARLTATPSVGAWRMYVIIWRHHKQNEHVVSRASRPNCAVDMEQPQRM